MKPAQAPAFDYPTRFEHSTKLYKQAMHYNKRLDCDKDGIACEKR